MKRKERLGVCLSHIQWEPKLIEHVESIMYPKREVFTFTSVREPLERMVSHYKYLFDQSLYANKTYDFDRFYKNREFVKQQRDNLMAWYLGYDNLEDITKESLTERYDYITVMDELGKSLNVVGDKWGYKLKWTDQNSTGSKVVVSDEVRELFKENNALDYKIYDLAKEIWFSEK